MDDALQTSKLQIKGSGLSEIPPRLRHRSRCSESENGSNERTDPSLSAESQNVPPQLEELATANIQAGDGVDNVSESQAKQSPANYVQSRTSYRSVFSLLGFELTRGYYLAGDESHYEERRERVYTFVLTPAEVEKFCIFGFLQCVDTFLFFTAFLPVRILIALLHLISYPCTLLFSRVQSGKNSEGKSHRMLQHAQVCDILKGLLFALAYFLVDFIDTSRMYHMVRGQAVIKLYVFYNMLDLADRLLSGAGQDVLDALYWTATEPGRKRSRFTKSCLHFALALGYVLLHTVLIVGQATVLNVAFNSHSKALLTIMISNNFVEIKSCLFKRIDKNNLLQISCSDVKERFHLSVLLFVVFVRNMAEFNWNFALAGDMIQDTLVVMAAEIVVDWVKHAFITKFNEISAETYRTFTINLAQDILTSQEKYAYTDYSDQVCRRLGFAPIPLMCMLVHMCSKSIAMAGSFSYLLIALFLLCLVSTKVLTSILLLNWGCKLLESAEEQGHQTNPSNIDSQVLAKKETAKSASPKDTASPSSQAHTLEPGSATTITQNLSNLEILSGNFVGREMTGEESGWKLFSVSDSVVYHQSPDPAWDLSQEPRPQTAPLFSARDQWEVDSVDSDLEFHNSLEETAASAAVRASSGTPVVDYDEEKKYK